MNNESKNSYLWALLFVMLIAFIFSARIWFGNGPGTDIARLGVLVRETVDDVSAISSELRSSIDGLDRDIGRLEANSLKLESNITELRRYRDESERARRIIEDSISTIRGLYKSK